MMKEKDRLLRGDMSEQPGIEKIAKQNIFPPGPKGKNSVICYPLKEASVIPYLYKRRIKRQNSKFYGQI
jgi:hypothetical protein